MTLYRDLDGRRHSLLDSQTSKTSEKVDSTTIDKYSQRHSPPDIVKVDVEGAAHRVIAGAGSVISTGDATWLIELHNEDERQAVEEEFDDATYERKWINNRHVVLDSHE